MMLMIIVGDGYDDDDDDAFSSQPSQRGQIPKVAL